MAIKSIDDIREEAKFGRKLFSLGAELKMNGPAAVADGLYENHECYELVKPRGRTVKYLANKEKDTDAIARTVQRHFDYVSPVDVPGNYMLAYSVLFDVSLDYLYGKIEDKCPNLEVLDISKKTGLSVTAVKRLMSNEEICLEEYLSALNNYNLLDLPVDNGYDPDADDIEDEDDYINTYASVTKFWSNIIENEAFQKIPENWYRMACAYYTSKAIKMVAEDAEKDMNTLPTLESFLSWVNTWETFHPDEPLHTIYGMTWEEAYEKEPEFIKQVYHEIRYNHYYSSIDKSEDYETAYWGCAGRFERSTLEFFHQMIDKWCKDGPLPDYFSE